jgi:hypothetical protein
MKLRLPRLWFAIALILTVWSITLAPRPEGGGWVQSIAQGRGPARILRFYASTGAVAPGQQVQLCYAVENARSIRISPLLLDLAPTANHCLQVAPLHTTHFTLMAEGFDGSVAARSFTLPVQPMPAMDLPDLRVLALVELANPGRYLL